MKTVKDVMDKEELDSIAAIVVYGNSFFLVKKKPDSNYYPELKGWVTGRIKPGETAETAALRELREETGLEGRIIEVGSELPSNIYPGKPIYPVLIQLSERPKPVLDGENYESELVRKNKLESHLRTHPKEYIPDLLRFLDALNINYR